MADQSRDGERYGIPDDYVNLDEVAAGPPIEEDRDGSSQARPSRQDVGPPVDDGYSCPGDYANLDEVAGPEPVDEAQELRRFSLEQFRSAEQAYQRERRKRSDASAATRPSHVSSDSIPVPRVSRFATELYTLSYLIFFSFLGTLARVGLSSLTFYPGAPDIDGVIWANFIGSLIMGFLSEDRRLFQDEWGNGRAREKRGASREMNGEALRPNRPANPSTTGSKSPPADLEAAKKAHGAVKKTIPLYIGLATGFCGSCTSFSTFINNMFLALSNDLPSPAFQAAGTATGSRNPGYSILAVLAVAITTLCLSLGALKVGAHLALFVQPITPTLPFRFVRKVLDPLMVFLALGCWLGVVIMAIWPPDRPGGPAGNSGTASVQESWRGQALFPLVFAPLGCLTRFYVSLHLNGRIASFPLGTFVVNIAGTVILGAMWDLQHASFAGVAGCQVLEGAQTGFSGCLTTVSTWVVELNSLRRRHAYIYGLASVAVAFCCLVVIMGTVRWTVGFTAPVCLD